jgi:hypothetical protein
MLCADGGARTARAPASLQGWVDKEDDDGYVPPYHQVVGDDGDAVDEDDDEEYLNRTDTFEHAYNFRCDPPPPPPGCPPRAALRGCQWRAGMSVRCCRDGSAF